MCTRVGVGAHGVIGEGVPEHIPVVLIDAALVPVLVAWSGDG